MTTINEATQDSMCKILSAISNTIKEEFNSATKKHVIAALKSVVHMIEELQPYATNDE